MSLHTEFDKGSLIWVKGEIEESLARTRESLQQYAEAGSDAALKHAQTYLHQVCGALTLVDLPGFSRFCEELEQTVALLSRGEISKEAIPLLQKGVDSAGGYLERLMGGMDNVPLLLLPAFREIAALRGTSQSGAELFFPQLQLDLPAGLPRRALDAAELLPFIRSQRSRFEAGLLRWLQGQDGAAQAMAASLADVAACQQLSVARAFWWTAAGLMLGLASNRGAIDLDLRQLLLRLNLQLRRLSDGSGKVAERLFRDMLYVLARIDCDSNLVHHLQRSFELGSLIPSVDALVAEGEREVPQLVGSLREDLRVLKDAWSRIAGGQRERLAPFPQQLAAVVQKSTSLEVPALDRLWQGLVDALNRYGQGGPGDLDALEFATGLLLADNALAVYPALSPDYAAQVDALLMRLANPAAESELPQLDDFSRQAQERLLMAQIAQEIRTNLRVIEETLDAYFRDTANSAVLLSLADPLRQVQGALLMLDRPNAVTIVRECQKRVDEFAAGSEPQLSDLESLAEALSMLGFYIDDLEQGRENEAMLRPARIQLCGDVEETESAESVAEALEAEPVQGEPAGVAVEVPEAPALAQEGKPLPVSEAAIDAELLEVYLEEAVEVLAAIASQVAVCEADPYDREALTLIRRSFHTLKGSGRMVGLFNLGEVAWAIEQCMNKLLQEEKPATADVLALIRQAHAAFCGWVEDLQQRGMTEVEASALIERAAVLRDMMGQEPVAEEVPTKGVKPALAEEIPPSIEQPRDIVIGDIVISPTLFEIFCDEAEKHLATLQRGMTLLAEQGEVDPPFILAAHTLGGIVSTTGFRPQGALAYALEHALQQLDGDARSEAGLLSETINTLSQMLAAITGRRMPAEAPDLIARLETVQPNISVQESIEGHEALTLDLGEEALPEEPAAETLPGLMTIDFDQYESVSLPEPQAEEAVGFRPAATEPGFERVEAGPSQEEAPAMESAPAKEEDFELTLEAEEDAEVAPDEEALELAEGAAEPSAEMACELETLSVVAGVVESRDTLAAQKAEIDAGFQDDLDDQLLPLFVEETDELMPMISAQLHALADGKDIDESLKRLKRALHTMKGSARMAGAMRVGEAAHRMETCLDGVTRPSEVLLSRLDDDYDLLQLLLNESSGRIAQTEPALATVSAAEAATLKPQAALAIAEPEGKATIRVKSDLIDELVNQAGEVSISRSRIEAEMLAFKGSLVDLTENVVRLRTQLREIEIQAESQMQAREKELQEHEAHFDPLEFDRFTRLQELTRFLAESVNDVSNVQQSLLKNLDESNAALIAQARMTRDLQQSLMRVRLVPFNSVAERLYRLARTTGKEVGKKVNLEFKGAAVEIDRGVLEKMISPFEHMLRNAIGHGLEEPAARLAAGKSEFGEILIEARQEGNELVLVLKDDGRGLDFERIRARALDKNLIQPDQQLSEHDLALLIFEAGFSTADNLTQLSGRGIGMDVVKNEIGNLGGRIDLVSHPGAGTTFTIRLPLTLAVTQVLLVRAGERMIAIPSVLVEQVQELKREPLAGLYARRELEWQGQRYAFAYLPRLLGDFYHQPEQKRYSTVLLLRSGTERIALHIDDLVKNLEVVVKPIGPQLARIPGVVGGTVLGTGEIVLIMNPLLLLSLADQIAAAIGPVEPEQVQAVQKQAEALQTVPVVMVVDDSLTVRKITGRLLAREGFQVVAAKDGVDALQQLQDVKPAVMLVDIEMPRMDGFELTRNVRAVPETRDIPIIMITSRTADKHRNVAFDLGVNVFLGKPYQEDELIGHVKRFAGMGRSVTY